MSHSRQLPATCQPNSFDPSHADAAVVAAASEILSECFSSVRQSDRAKAVQVVAGLPPELWPTEDHRHAAHAVRSLVSDCRPVDRMTALLEARRLGLPLDSARFDGATTVRDFVGLLEPRVAALRDHAARRALHEKLYLARSVLEDGADLGELRIVLADLDVQSVLPEPAPVLPLSDFSNWQALAATPVEAVFAGGPYRKALAVLAAEPAAGKSFLALQAALSLALGRTLVKAFEPQAPGKVLALFAEDPAEVVARRMASVAAAHQIDPADLSGAIEAGRLTFACGTSAPLLSFDAAGNAAPTATYVELLRHAKATKPDLIVADPLISWAGLPSENDNAAMQKITDALIGLAQAAGGCVLALHHVNKSGSRELAQASARGGSALTGAARWCAAMRPLSAEDGERLDISPDDLPNFVELAVTKNSYAARAGAPVILRRNADGVLSGCDLRRERIGTIAELLAAAIVETGADATSRDVVRKVKDGKAVAAFIQERLGSVGRREFEAAISYGLQFGLLRTEARAGQGERLVANG